MKARGDTGGWGREGWELRECKTSSNTGNNKTLMGKQSQAKPSQAQRSKAQDYEHQQLGRHIRGEDSTEPGD